MNIDMQVSGAQVILYFHMFSQCACFSVQVQYEYMLWILSSIFLFVIVQIKFILFAEHFYVYHSRIKRLGRSRLTFFQKILLFTGSKFY